MEQQIENLIKDLIQNHGTIPYVEYYSHKGGDCYKINNPYTNCNKETIVLCRCDNKTFLEALTRAKIALDKKYMEFFGNSVKG